MKPRATMRGGLRVEADEAREFREWLRARGIDFDEAPRHGPQHRRRGNGIAKGRADFLLTIGGRPVAVELKRYDGGTVDEAQAEWLREFRRRGGITAVCFGAVEAIEFVLAVQRGSGIAVSA